MCKSSPVRSCACVRNSSWWEFTGHVHVSRAWSCLKWIHCWRCCHPTQARYSGVFTLYSVLVVKHVTIWLKSEPAEKKLTFSWAYCTTPRDLNPPAGVQRVSRLKLRCHRGVYETLCSSSVTLLNNSWCMRSDMGFHSLKSALKSPFQHLQPLRTLIQG